MAWQEHAWVCKAAAAYAAVPADAVLTRLTSMLPACLCICCSLAEESAREKAQASASLAVDFLSQAMRTSQI